MQSLAGNRIDKYDVIEEVGHGGMAIVYRGRDTVLDREVAIKVLHAHLADREESRERLRREALTVAKLRHDNIVEIFDYSGANADESYIITEFIRGRTMREWLDSRWRPHPVLAALLVHRLCLPLIQAHELGIVHRDIKPENVMIRDDGCLKLMDFGIAQILDHQKLTMTGQLLGSPAYMAPELISGKPVDARTDLFAVGIMLYQLATGKLPFAGRNPHEVLNRIADAQYTKPSSICPLVDESLEALIQKALARDPNDRFQSARAFANELEDYLAELEIEPTPELIGEYFDNTEVFVDALDTKICGVLLDRAETATAEGHSARALRCLGRVLELDPDNGRAKSLLDRARIRGQRMRQLLLAGASVAFVGLVAAAWMLMKPRPEGDHGTSTARASSKIADRSPPTADLSTGEGGSDGRHDPDASDAQGAPDGTDGTDIWVDPEGRSDPTRIEPREAHEMTDIRIARPQRRHRAPCTLRIAGIPAAPARHHRVSIAGVDDALTISPGTFTVDFKIEGNTHAKLLGKTFTGNTEVRLSDCARGVVLLHAKPKPARLEFASNVSELTVQCTEGCETSPSAKRKRLDQQFPSLGSPTGDDREWRVTLRFWAVGYKTATRSYFVGPGNNEIRVALDPA